MSRVRTLATTAAVLGLAGALTLTGCSNSSSSSAAATPAASGSAAASAGAASAAPSDAEASAAASELAADPSPIPSNLTKSAFCLLASPLVDKAALPKTDSQTGMVLAAKRLIKATQALGQAESLKALTGKQVAEIQVTMAILLTLLQDPSLEKGTVEQMSKASGVDTNTLQIAQTQGFKDESAAAFVDLGTFCS